MSGWCEEFQVMCEFASRTAKCSGMNCKRKWTGDDYPHLVNVVRNKIRKQSEFDIGEILADMYISGYKDGLQMVDKVLKHVREKADTVLEKWKEDQIRRVDE